DGSSTLGPMMDLVFSCTRGCDCVDRALDCCLEDSPRFEFVDQTTLRLPPFFRFLLPVSTSPAVADPEWFSFVLDVIPSEMAISDNNLGATIAISARLNSTA